MYLIIGATDMVGAHLVCTMLRQGYDVRAIKAPGDNPEYTKHILSLYSNDYEILYKEIEWVDAEYDNFEQMQKALKDVQKAFCCLQPTLSNKRTIDDNIETIRNIVTAVQESDNCEYLMYLSSTSALGDEPDMTEINEKSQRNPKGQYSKISETYYRCEMEVWRAMQEGLRAGIINSAKVLGPGDWQNDRSKFVNSKIYQKYYTDGVTGLVSINDLVKCIMAMAKQQICNENFVVSGHNVSFKNLQQLFAEVQNTPEPARKANWIRMLYWKTIYAWESAITKRRPFIDNEFFDDLTQFHLYSNKKSIGRLIIDYEPIETTIKMICALREKSMEMANITTSSK